jgi:hypothetical protein
MKTLNLLLLFLACGVIHSKTADKKSKQKSSQDKTSLPSSSRKAGGISPEELGLTRNEDSSIPLTTQVPSFSSSSRSKKFVNLI